MTEMRPTPSSRRPRLTDRRRCGLDAQLIGANARAAMLRSGQYAGSGNQVDVGELGTTAAQSTHRAP